MPLETARVGSLNPRHKAERCAIVYPFSRGKRNAEGRVQFITLAQGNTKTRSRCLKIAVRVCIIFYNGLAYGEDLYPGVDGTYQVPRPGPVDNLAL